MLPYDFTFFQFQQLSKSEEETHRLQAELVKKVGELERLSRQLAQSNKELEVKNEALENTKSAR